MKIIKKLCELIDEELCDAEKYAKLALKYKDEDTELAALFYNLSLEETRHMNQLHNAVVKKVEEAKASGKDDPRTEGMKIAYDMLHEKAIEEAKEVSVMQSMYRE